MMVLHLRSCRRGRAAKGRGLLPTEKPLVVVPARKDGKVNEMLCYHKLEAYLDKYVEAAVIASDSPWGRCSDPRSARRRNQPRGDVGRGRLVHDSSPCF